MKKIILIPAVLFFVIGHSSSQSISGIVNHYLRVSSINGDTVNYYNDAGEEAFFTEGDKVLMIQMTGTTYDLIGGEGNRGEYVGGAGSFISYKNCGSYEILQIAEIFPGTNKILFTANFLNAYDNDEKIQLVKVAEYENATINSTIYAKDWDGDSTGGIAALIVYDTLKMQANIDVGRKGFQGAQPELNFTGLCRSEPDTVNFLPTEFNRAGNKGEGNMTTTFPYTKGVFYNATGGGGGNGLYSGGGGGSNFGSGGLGGRQDMSCGTNHLALGGMLDNSLYSAQKITMGGGGGSGVQGPANLASKGGDGGGIAIIMANVLVINGRKILAKGEDVPSPRVTASGGGGGGGGTILLDVNTYLGSFDSLSVRGGRGGNTYTTGTGGGGGGGVIWHSGLSIPVTKIDTAFGAPGSPQGTPTQGSNGSYGRLFKSLILPLNGFLFNTIKGIDSVCAGQRPGLITGSQPKGGNDIFAYKWQDSTDATTWNTIPGAIQKDFTPDTLYESTHFRRIVTSENANGTITDISKSVEVYVYPAIGNNIVYGNDTICSGNSPLPITGTNEPTGGDGTNYTFQWLQSANGDTYDLAGIETDSYVPLSPGTLTQTMYYSRLVTSAGYCRDTSNMVVVLVAPQITGNNFMTPDTTVCENQNPELAAPVPVYGFGTFTYLWQKSETGSWSDIPGSNTADLFTGPLSRTTLFRRVVHSGDEPLGCVDTSGSKTVNVLPSITNNSIHGTTAYACYNSSKQLTAATPQNGSQGNYAYTWQSSGNLSTWSDISGANSLSYTVPELTTSRYFRRIVFSSATARECSDTSDYIRVLLNQLPTGDIVNSEDTICAGESAWVRFTVSGVHGPWDVTVGNGTVSETKEGIQTAGSDSVLMVFNESQTIQILSIVDDSLCSANIDLTSGQALVEVYEVPQADAGEDNEVCGLQAVLSAQKNIPGSAGNWSVQRGSFDDPSLENATVTMQTYGPASLKWTETNWKCMDSDSIQVIFYEQPTDPYAGPDQLLDFRFQTSLASNPPQVGSGTWSVSTGDAEFDDPADAGTTVRGLGYDNVLKWTVTNGVCIPVSDSMNIIVNPLKIVHGFSPNADGLNDGFAIKIENAEKIEMTIFNRLGQKVFESGDYSEGNFWKGSNNKGIDLPEGTYFYVLKVKIMNKEQEFVFKSYVELVRRK